MIPEPVQMVKMAEVQMKMVEEEVELASEVVVDKKGWG